MLTELRYQIPPGTVLKQAGCTLTLHRDLNDHYRLRDEWSGTSEVRTYRETVNLLRSPGVSVPGAGRTPSAASARIQEGGRDYPEQLSKELQEQIELRYALCLGIQALAERGVRITSRALDQKENRRFIIGVAQQHFSGRVISDGARGGSVKHLAVVPKGRTLNAYFRRFVESGFDKMSLPDHSWKKGNRSTDRVPDPVRQIIGEAIDEVWLDPRKPTVAEVLREVEDRIKAENVIRAANELKPLKPVSHATVARHIGTISSTAQQFAREGEEAVRNKRVRGATDNRAFMIGEVVEIDECKLSLIVIAKEKGLWQRLSEGDRAALEEIEEVISRRLWFGLMLDVATAMPLAWVLTDTPSADATLELYRMATRDKAREKTIYGCESDPMPAVGLGCIRGDNGTGLRNGATRAAAIGIGAQPTDGRAGLGFEKSGVERIFGTMENELLNMLHGYTGRRAGAPTRL